MKILSLHADNVMRLNVVDITPDGSTVVVGGRNAQGKSSVLRSIEMALGGKDAAPRTPVRAGESSAHIVVDLGDIIVKRRITADGKSTLAVESREGATFKSPQSMLDELVGSLSFDPLAFSRMKPRDAADVLCRLVGLDLAKFHARRQAVYDERTAVNRQLKSLEHGLAVMPVHVGVPAEPVSAAEVAAELQAAREAQAAADKAEQASVAASFALEERDAHILEAASEIEICRQRLANAEARKAELESTRGDVEAAARSAIAEAEKARSAVPDADAIKARLAEVEAINARVRDNAARARHAVTVEAERTRSQEMTKQIEAIDAEKIATITSATFPVPGLSIDDDGVTLNGIPFEQASSAEQLRASVAIGIAMNPKLRVLLVRDGSLLDADGLRLLGELAAEHDAQVWVERVADNATGCTVYIEDGSVVMTADAVAAE